MAKPIIYLLSGLTTIILLIVAFSIGNAVLLPAIFVAATVVVGALCLHVAHDMIVARDKVMQEWEAKHPE